MARVSTYLNFPRITEEVFNFYKSVFGGEFGNGLMRFSDIPRADGSPQLADIDKNLIIHIELSLPGGHLLMGTDAPESMGFKLIPGNNIHINVELDTKAETTRLFKALADGGKITMELQDMFWGGYYGSCTDKFGIQWMFNFNSKPFDQAP
jgi:PhnB protein